MTDLPVVPVKLVTMERRKGLLVERCPYCGRQHFHDGQAAYGEKHAVCGKGRYRVVRWKNGSLYGL